MFIKFVFLLLALNLSGCLKQNEIVYVYLSQNQNKLVTKVNGSTTKNFDDIGDKLSYFYKEDKKYNIDLYVIFTDGVAFSDAENIIKLAQKIGYYNIIGYPNITLYTINTQTKKMYEINMGRAIPVADNVLTFIGAK